MPILKTANPDKNLEIEFDDQKWSRFPVKTPVILPEHKIEQICLDEIGKNTKDGDILIIAESVVAITDGRAFRMTDIHPRWLATFLSRFVSRVSWGIGLGRPQTMELALREVGTFRILFAALIAALTRPLGLKGMFYHIAGDGARSIDGPCDFKLPPYNEWATMGPAKPNQTAQNIAKTFDTKIDVVIIDANDLGTRALGATSRTAARLGENLTRDNPMGQKNEQTPIILARKK